MSTPQPLPEFTATDALRLLDVAVGDPALGPAGVMQWLDRHISNSRSAFTCLWTVAEITARLVGHQGSGQPVGFRVEPCDGSEAPWSMRMCEQMLGTAANHDNETLSAVVHSVIRQGPERFVEVLADLLVIFRTVAYVRADDDGQVNL